MVVDYDLSNLPTDQAEVWICLQADNICAQIMTAQAERLGFPLALGDRIVAAMTQKQQAIFPTLNEGRA
jgi:hypothetical protein